MGHRILENVVSTKRDTSFIGWHSASLECSEYPFRYYPEETTDYAGYAVLLDDDLATFYFGDDLLSKKVFVPVPLDLTLEEAQAWAIGVWSTSS